MSAGMSEVPSPTLLGYIVAIEDDDEISTIEWSGEPQETIAEARRYMTQPGDIVVAVHRLPGGDAG